MAGIVRCSPARMFCSLFLLLLTTIAAVCVFQSNIYRSTHSTIPESHHKRGHQMENVSFRNPMNSPGARVSNLSLINENNSLKNGSFVSLLPNHSKSAVREKSLHHHKKTLRNASHVDLPTLSAQALEEIEKFVFFIGYPRSSHSIIASMIDAHPNAVLAHEFNLFAKLVHDSQKLSTLLESKASILNALYQNSYKQSVSGWRSNNTQYNHKGYTLKLSASESWQGKFMSLKVIGDKSGATTARAYKEKPEVFKAMYVSLSALLKVPMLVLHVVRNPYDMIATRLLYRYGESKGLKANFNETHKLKAKSIGQAIQALYSEAKAVTDMVKDCNLNVVEIHNVDFVRDPKAQMQRICDFLGLECFQQYLEMCEAGTYRTLSKTRHVVEWGDEERQAVEEMTRTFPFFRRYSFESD